MQMNFHPDKCHVLHLGQSNPQNIYHMENASGNIHVLDVVTSEKDLGVIIDHQLKFSDHIENAAKKANRDFGCLARKFRHLNKETFLLLYKATVRPHLEYATCIWCPHLKKRQRPHRTSSAAGNTTGPIIQQQTNTITASYLELGKTENRHHPDIQNQQKNRLGQPGLQMYTVPIKADVQKSKWYNQRAQQKTTNTESD